MKKKRIVALLLCFGLLIPGCGKADTRAVDQKTELEQSAKNEKTDDAENTEVVAQNGEKSRKVLMVYMVGSNLESEAGLASGDIHEMERSGFDEENLKVLICTGGSSKWWNTSISEDTCQIFEVTEDGLTEVCALGDRSMADTGTLTSFIDYTYQAYPADQYDMVFWNHGGGAVLGYGADEKYNYDALSVSDMDDALSATKMAADGKKFTWVGFDACLMGMLEVADMMSEYADYMIASEEVEAGEGWNYDFLSDLSDGEHETGIQAAKCIVDGYGSYYEENYKYVPDYTLSCMDLSRTDDVIEKLDDFVIVAEEELKAGDYSAIAKMRDQAKTFGKVSETAFYDTIDLYDLCDQMSGLYPEESKKLQGAISDCIVAQSTNVSSAHGMAIYFPYENKDYVNEWLDAYSETGFSQNYIAFVKDFSATLSGEPISEWNMDMVAPVEDEETPGEYYVQLTDEQLATYGHATYQLWEEDPGYEGTYVQWLNSSNVTLSEDGKLSTDFEGKMFYLVDSNGASLRCCAKEIERTDTYSKFALPLMYSPQGEETPYGVYAHVRVDAEHPEGELIGFYKIADASNGYFPEKNQVKVSEGDYIYPFYFARKIIFNEDGSVAPFDEWKMNSGIGDTYIVSDPEDFYFTIKTVDDSGQPDPYCCLFQISDTQGNYYYTNPVYIEK